MRYVSCTHPLAIRKDFRKMLIPPIHAILCRIFCYLERPLTLCLVKTSCYKSIEETSQVPTIRFTSMSAPPAPPPRRTINHVLLRNRDYHKLPVLAGPSELLLSFIDWSAAIFAPSIYQANLSDSPFSLKLAIGKFGQKIWRDFI